MFDPFAGRHPPPRKPPLPVVGLRMAYPIRCPYCRDRLQSRYNRMFGWWRWCRRHQCVVSYCYEDGHDGCDLVEYVAALW